MFPFFRHIFFHENRLNGTFRFTDTTVDAFFGIDIELIYLFIFIGCVRRMRVNTIHGTHVYTGTVFYVDAGFANYVRHLFNLLFIYFFLLRTLSMLINLGVNLGRANLMLFYFQTMIGQ